MKIVDNFFNQNRKGYKFRLTRPYTNAGESYYFTKLKSLKHSPYDYYRARHIDRKNMTWQAMAEAGLIKRNEATNCFEITQKGLNYIEFYKRG